MAKTKAPSREIVATAFFLVRVGDNFFVGFNNSGQALATAAPSRAKHFCYGDADTCCQSLIARGYRDVWVTDAAGNCADLLVIDAAEKAAAERFRRFWHE